MSGADATAKPAGAGILTRPISKCAGWKYLYRAIDRDGALVDVMLSDHRDLAAAKAFFRSAKAVTGVMPDRVTTDGHDACPQAIQTELGDAVRHRTNVYLNNRLEQDHRGIKSRCRSMLGFKSATSARRYCRNNDELRNFLRCRTRMRQRIPPATDASITCTERRSHSASWKPLDERRTARTAVDGTLAPAFEFRAGRVGSPSLRRRGHWFVRSHAELDALHRRPPQAQGQHSAVARPWDQTFLGFTVKDEPEFRRCIAEVVARFKPPSAHPYSRIQFPRPSF